MLYAMCVGILPFMGKSDKDLKNSVCHDPVTFPNDCQKLSLECKDIICKMLTKDPEERIGMLKIKEHPFYKVESIGHQMEKNFEAHMKGDTIPLVSDQTVIIEEVEISQKEPEKPTKKVKVVEIIDFTEKTNGKLNKGYGASSRGRASKSPNKNYAKESVHINLRNPSRGKSKNKIYLDTKNPRTPKIGGDFYPKKMTYDSPSNDNYNIRNGKKQDKISTKNNDYRGSSNDRRK